MLDKGTMEDIQLYVIKEDMNLVGGNITSIDWRKRDWTLVLIKNNEVYKRYKVKLIQVDKEWKVDGVELMPLKKQNNNKNN